MKQAYGKFGYTKEFIETRETAEQEHQAELESNRQENKAARERYLKTLEGKRRQMRAEDDAAFDAAVVTDKAAHKRQWLIDHPTFDGDHYEKSVWPLVREEMLSQRKKAALEVQRDTLLRSGAYDL